MKLVKGHDPSVYYNKNTAEEMFVQGFGCINYIPSSAGIATGGKRFLFSP
jgi:hypothetical protein